MEERKVREGKSVGVAGRRGIGGGGGGKKIQRRREGREVKCVCVE